MRKTYDVFVIGTGTAGYTLAQICSKGGKKVGICDNRPMGGTCAMRGCQPKKYLVTAAEIAGLSAWMADVGISPGAKMDWSDVVQALEAFTSRVPKRVEKSFEEAQIDVLTGTARFVGPGEVEVDGVTVSADRFVVATGSEPRPLDIPGEEHVKTSEYFLHMAELPKRIVFVGGGYISMEFAHIARIGGAEVTVLEGNDHLLTPFDQELVGELIHSAEEAGITIITDFPVCEVRQDGSSFSVHGDENCSQSYSGDLVVHGAGRIPSLAALDLDAGGVAYSARGIKVNEFMQSTSNPAVYAVGDVVAGSPQLSTVADMEAEAAAENILHGNLRAADYADLPSVVFTFPPLAGVGMTEAEAKAKGLRFHMQKGSMASWPSSRRIGQKRAMYKVLIEEETDRILGVHIFGHSAGEIINVFALAMKFNLTGKDLKKVLWAYPTATSDLKYMI